jgi:hypothetical protein
MSTPNVRYREALSLSDGRVLAYLQGLVAKHAAKAASYRSLAQLQRTTEGLDWTAEERERFSNATDARAATEEGEAQLLQLATQRMRECDALVGLLRETEAKTFLPWLHGEARELIAKLRGRAA